MAEIDETVETTKRSWFYFIKKWQYDIWGDTVNIASRMESASVPGKINISESTYNEIKNEFKCEYRGEIEVKNRGLLKMYFLT